MAKRMNRQSGLADPSRLTSHGNEGRQTLHVVVETPKGSRNKYAFDQEQRVFILKKVLPVGMAFPYDFGFIPSTKGGDGDPVDVLVLMDEPAFPGCLLKCRPVGIIEGEQVDRKTKTKERNDRIVAVENANHSYAHIAHVNKLGKKFVHELEEFFVNYHQLTGQKYRVLDVKGPGAARRRIKNGIRAVKKSSR